MSRRILLTLFIVTSSAILSSSAFCGAVLSSDGYASAGKGALRRDTNRLFSGTRADVISAPFSLASHRAGSLLTFTGVNAVQAEVTFPTALEDLDVTMGAVTAPNLSPAPPVPEKVGSASSFAAVPEPSSIALAAMGALAFLRRRRA